mmetsp:Transcript_118446/g.346933  ORF Transcript_118446/g.346933 Transcript_118446/m.346933 type:complete len:469 (+) Transcript_118446:58-1464(+)
MPSAGTFLFLAATSACADRDSLSPGSNTLGPGEPVWPRGHLTSEENTTSSVALDATGSAFFEKLFDKESSTSHAKRLSRGGKGHPPRGGKGTRTGVIHPKPKVDRRTSKRRPHVEVVDPTRGTSATYRATYNAYHWLTTAKEEPLPEEWTKKLSKLEEIRSGAYGAFYRGKVLCDESRSMVVKRETVRKDNPEGDIQDEINMMKKFKGKRFINFYDVQVGSKHTHVDILIENGQGGPLFNYLYRDTQGVLSRQPGLSGKVRWQLFVEILQGIKAMHDEGYMHLNLKPENIFVDADCLETRCHAKIGDLRDACSHSPPAGLESTQCKNVTKGTVEYFAPELWNHFKEGQGTDATVYTKAIDIWALGMMLYEIQVSFHRLPRGILQCRRWEPGLKAFITKFDITRDHYYKYETEALQSLLAGMLAKDVEKRWDVNKVLTAAKELAETSEANLDDDGTDFSQPPACWGKAS